MGIMEAVIEIPADDAGNVFGQFDAFAKKDRAVASCDTDFQRWKCEDHGGQRNVVAARKQCSSSAS